MDGYMFEFLMVLLVSILGVVAYLFRQSFPTKEDVSNSIQGVRLWVQGKVSDLSSWMIEEIKSLKNRVANLEARQGIPRPKDEQDKK